MDNAHGAEPRSDTAAVPLDITFESRGNTLIGLGLWNGAMKLVTLGLYGSWAKAEVRRRIWSFIRLNGEPLEYTGTGLELFLGFVIATLFVVLPAAVGALIVAFAFPQNSGAFTLYQAALYAVFFLLIGNAIYRAWRYRLSRTRWRGIRGTLAGTPTHYGWTYFWTVAIPIAVIAVAAGIAAWLIGPEVGGTIMVLGFIAGLWVLPWRANKLRAMMTNDARFGDRPLMYDGHSGPLYKAYLAAWIGCALVLISAIAATVWIALRSGIRFSDFEPPAAMPMPPISVLLSIAGVWIAALVLAAVLTASYRAKQYQHFAAHTHFEGAVFRSTVSGGGLLWITLSNWALTLIAVIIAVAGAATLFYGLDLVPTGTTDPTASGEPAFQSADLLRAAVMIGLLVLTTTVATTIAQLRSARYLMSRLKLDGNIDPSAIAQSASAAPSRGEGLAQVFELDAF